MTTDRNDAFVECTKRQISVFYADPDPGNRHTIVFSIDLPCSQLRIIV